MALQVLRQGLPGGLRRPAPWMVPEGTSIPRHPSRWGKELAVKGGRLDAGKEVGWGRGAVIAVCHGGDGDRWVGGCSPCLWPGAGALLSPTLPPCGQRAAGHGLSPTVARPEIRGDLSRWCRSISRFDKLSIAELGRQVSLCVPAALETHLAPGGGKMGGQKGAR